MGHDATHRKDYVTRHRTRHRHNEQGSDSHPCQPEAHHQEGHYFKHLTQGHPRGDRTESKVSQVNGSVHVKGGEGNGEKKSGDQVDSVVTISKYRNGIESESAFPPLRVIRQRRSVRQQEGTKPCYQTQPERYVSNPGGGIKPKPAHGPPDKHPPDRAPDAIETKTPLLIL